MLDNHVNVRGGTQFPLMRFKLMLYFATFHFSLTNANFEKHQSQNLSTSNFAMGKLHSLLACAFILSTYNNLLMKAKKSKNQIKGIISPQQIITYCNLTSFFLPFAFNNRLLQVDIINAHASRECNFATGTILGKGFPQALVHTVPHGKIRHSVGCASL